MGMKLEEKMDVGEDVLGKRGKDLRGGYSIV
jgi:hypothetical protein